MRLTARLSNADAFGLNVVLALIANAQDEQYSEGLLAEGLGFIRLLFS